MSRGYRSRRSGRPDGGSEGATSERDNLAIQYEAFRKNIKNLLGQAETSLNTPRNPTSPASPPPPAKVNN
ncbi:MAG: hypothetical protein U0792_10900 [Gemmataceae bacterium]